MIFTDIVCGFYLVAPGKWQAKFTKESTKSFRNLDCSNSQTSVHELNSFLKVVRKPKLFSS